MSNNPEWYLIEIAPADKTNLSAGNGFRFETPAGDLEGAKWLAENALIKLTRSKDITPNRFVSVVTPCSDC